MRPRLTVVAICRNEKQNVKHFLGSIGLVADEIVVADTGSTDGTQEEFKKFGFMEKGRSTLKLRHFKWRDDFAAARNFSLAHATGEWVLWMDLDDRLAAGAPEFINGLKKHDHQNTAFGFQIASQTEEEGAYVRFIQLRMFPNIRGLGWRKPIHESLHESMDFKGIKLQPIPECVIIHTGYVDPILKQQKAIRNATILEKQTEETYERFYQLGDAYYAMSAFDIGCVNYYKARGLAVTDLQRNSATERIILGRSCMGERDIARKEYELLPKGVPEQLFWEANFAFEDKDYDKAGPIYEKILEIQYEAQSMNSYLDAYKAHAMEKLGWMLEQCNAEEAKKEEVANG
jgi:glycosyltransferase involved in cell wall biosynthesis